MSLTCYERNRGLVLEHFQQGEFDFIDAVNEVSETEFFRFIQAKKYLQALAETYPSPRKKLEVPTSIYIASNLAMRLHGVHSFHAYPYVVRIGGMLNAFGPEVAHKTTHPETGEITLSCKGFNKKNDFPRQTPCDQDYLRKFSKDTDPKKLERWFNSEVPKILKEHKVFDPEGIFLGDASYLFVPDNEAYEGSAVLLFDKNDRPVDPKEIQKLSDMEKLGYRWRRCYKLVTLMHTDRERSFVLWTAFRLLPGNAHECPHLFELVFRFVADVGEGVIKRLILDRGFLDGAKIAECKLRHGIEVLIPLKKNMDLYQDALGLIPEISFSTYEKPKKEPLDPPRLPKTTPRIQKREIKRQEKIKAKKEKTPPPAPDKVLLRSEVGGANGFQSFSSCPLPLSVVLNREVYADGHEDIWMLLDTQPLEAREDPSKRRTEYGIRTGIEEGYRQGKCFWDLSDFTSRSFSLILNQVTFVFLAQNLLQIYLRNEKRKDLSRRTRPRIRDHLMPSASVIIIYFQSYYATFDPLEYTQIVLTLPEEARPKILEKTRRLRREMVNELVNARPP